ncbi:hypothetical protein B0H10DRAFT_2195854 [Mycena sp. CBHHK59/15]|nr:hypothetical protein B0H10DRAFT_2195854 [Mycena sp. CBHHK59/15]
MDSHLGSAKCWEATTADTIGSKSYTPSRSAGCMSVDSIHRPGVLQMVVIVKRKSSYYLSNELKANKDWSQEVGFSRKHHSSEGCATVWGGAEMREGPEWRRREIGGRPEVWGSTRGGPEMNRKTGNGPEGSEGQPEVDRKWTRRKIE